MKRITSLLIFAIGSILAAPASTSFTEKEITVRTADGTEMGATLTAPASGTPKAAIVLATGSGTQNRDEEIMGKTPFRTIAEYLSDRGFAVLRADDRVFSNPADAEGATMETYSGDVASAVAVADSIFSNIPVGILGHSAGGSYAVMNAVRNPSVDFIITLAGPAWSGDSLIMSQSRAIAMGLTGRWDAEAGQRRLTDAAKSPLPSFSARALLTTIFSDIYGDAAKLPEVAPKIQEQISVLLSPWYRSMLRYDPAADIRAVRCPWLALNGEKDMQVLKENLDTVRELNPDADTRVMPGHNHMFQKCQTGLVQEYATLPGDISPETLEVIADWLDKSVRAR